MNISEPFHSSLAFRRSTDPSRHAWLVLFDMLNKTFINLARLRMQHCDIYSGVNGHAPGRPALPAPGAPLGVASYTAPRAVRQARWPPLRNEDGNRCTGAAPWLAFASVNDLSSHFVSPVDLGSIVNTKSSGVSTEPYPSQSQAQLSGGASLCIRPEEIITSA